MSFLNIQTIDGLREIGSCLSGLLIVVSFGLMLGWPSLSYPHMVDPETSLLYITYDQTSLIAGFLMEGNAIGSVASTQKYIKSKYSIIIAACLQLVGFIVLYFSKDMWWLLVARGCVGLGHGFGVPQLKKYIKETCESERAQLLINYLPLGVNIGVIISFFIGAFTTYKVMEGCFIAAPILCLVTFLPTMRNPRVKLQTEVELTPCEMVLDVWETFKTPKYWLTILLMFIIVFTQQFSGGPIHIVYSQWIFINAGSEYPKLCSVLYAIAFLIFSVIALAYSKTFRRKPNLIISCLVTFLTTTAMVYYYHYKDVLIAASPALTWLPLVIQIIYNAFHTFGLGTVPLLFIGDIAPPHSKNYVSKFQVIIFSISAVFVTRYFQRLFTYYNYSTAYELLSTVALFGLICSIFFVPETKPEEEGKERTLKSDWTIFKLCSRRSKTVMITLSE